MDDVQTAIVNLQRALQKRPCCDQQTQTDELSNYELMKHHIELANKYMMLLEQEPTCEQVLDSEKWGVKSVVNETDTVSEVSTDDCNVNEAILAEERPTPREKDGRKKRKRQSGAEDDDSFVMERHERVYLAFKPDDKSWRFKCVLKDKGVTWDEADTAIMKKMNDVSRNGKCVENAFTQREKLVQLYSEQRGISYREGEEEAAGMTNLELFVSIKKTSPGFISSGLPTPSAHSLFL